jgi:hypothetical protein
VGKTANIFLRTMVHHVVARKLPTKEAIRRRQS